MTSDKGIFIKNIYYMLSYAFKILKQTHYEKVAAEEFENVQDLFAAILAKGVAQQVKQGLYREYIPMEETLAVMRGKLDMQGTIRNRIQRRQKLDCEYDELSENNLMNQIIKTTMYYLVKDSGVKQERKNALKKLLVYFDGIEMPEPSSVQWNRIQYQRNNRSYEMLINICYLVLEGMLQTTESGQYRMVAFSDEHMERLYEKFILEYYRQEHTELDDVRAAEVKWDLMGEYEPGTLKFLPKMQTDVMLRMGNRTLIIDAKYYTRVLQSQYNRETFHSNNLYQIFAYVKNTDIGNTGNVSGLLLYAKTDEDVTPDTVFNMAGNQIGARTLDLNKDFSQIQAQLDGILGEFLVDERMKCA
ncbi:MAG: 5-methylcytosine-specific restriction endonuclease system specificity protein McrC [Clostridiales bacterium]|nr:5-methylcytosine-specific restriction endonuclease system specificity protein McrC [Clostridiales bacterium]